jgi:hypothetical protein
MFRFKFGDKKPDKEINKPKKEETIMEEKKVNLSAPWIGYARQVNALFGKDPEIKVEYDENAIELKLFVESGEKAEALTELLPSEVKFGNVALKVSIIPADGTKDKNFDLICKAFKGNPAVSFTYSCNPGDMSANSYNFVVFKNETVQYWNDNLGDVHGNVTTVYENIARDVIEKEGVLYCTDLPGNPGPGQASNKPLGEWP